MCWDEITCCEERCLRRVSASVEVLGTWSCVAEMFELHNPDLGLRGLSIWFKIRSLLNRLWSVRRRCSNVSYLSFVKVTSKASCFLFEAYIAVSVLHPKEMPLCWKWISLKVLVSLNIYKQKKGKQNPFMLTVTVCPQKCTTNIVANNE